MRWIKSFVIALNVCPFAKHVVENEGLDLVVLYPVNIETVMSDLMTAITHLENDNKLETILLVCGSKFLDQFDFYLNICDQAEEWMSQNGWDGIYQLATFHPNYCFSGVHSDDSSNYTNRSPYPMLHILRERSIDQALVYYGDTSNIPDENIANMHRIGVKKIHQILSEIM